MTLVWPKVVVADDDPSVQRLLGAMLRASGYKVRQVADGQQALAAIEEDCPHYLITDWLMPGLTGPDLCRAVRKLSLRNYVYILIVTGKSSSSDMVAGLDAGADDFLTKPVDRSELLARMASGARVLSMERTLNEMAHIDPLTGLATRRSFLQQAERELHRAVRQGTPLSCVMVDIDFFKKVNDTHGHPVGDQVLREVAAALKSNCRGNDIIGRYGGEEFCAILSETNESAAGVWAERIREKLGRLLIPVEAKTITITASLGVASRLDDLKDVAGLIDLADQALLVAKQSGRNRVVRYQTLHQPSSLAPAIHDHPFEGVVARNVMTALVACLREQETIGQAAEFFLRFRINSCPVVDGHGRLVGILSEKDVINVITQPDAWSQPVANYMQKGVVCFDEETPVKTIHEFLCRVSIRRVIIVKDGWPTGLIGRGTILRWYRNWLAVGGARPLNAEAATVPQGQLASTVEALSRCTTELQARVQRGGESNEIVPLLIDETTRIQELAQDLLTLARSLAPPVAEGNAATISGAAELQFAF